MTDLVSSLARVRDEELLAEAHSARAARLLEEILEQPPRPPRTVRLMAAAVGLALAAVVTTAAFGGIREFRSWLRGGHGPDFPIPAGEDIVIASGVAGGPWRIVATPSDQGLCLFLVTGAKAGSGGCGYVDVRGNLPAEVRGDPSTRCLATPTTVVPCGSLPRHWIDSPGGNGRIAFAAAAEGVARVDLVLASGRTVHARLVEQPGGLGLSVYWAKLPRSGVVAISIARDPSGRVLERRAPPWNGNPTGDPKGPRAPSTPQAA